MFLKLIKGAMALAVFLTIHSEVEAQGTDKDLGKEAPRLIPAGWAGTPVSPEVLRKSGSDTAVSDGSTVAADAGAVGGNTVVLAFWNADIPC